MSEADQSFLMNNHVQLDLCYRFHEHIRNLRKSLIYRRRVGKLAQQLQVCQNDALLHGM